ncbi:MAG: hypothetical protein AAFX41_03345 [Bacteroidota bacterium]
MHILLDHAAAIIAGSIAALLLLGTMARSSQEDQRMTALAVAKDQAFAFSTWLEEDFSAVGMGLPEGEVRLTPPTMDTCNGATCTRQFTFVRRSYDTTTSPATPQTHEFRLTLNPTTTVANEDGSSLQLYEVQRSERIGGGAWVQAGASPASLSHFRISLQDNSGAPTASESDAAFVEVAFSLVPPLLHDDLLLSELNWSAVFRLHPV